jgi:hypothetical protein
LEVQFGDGRPQEFLKMALDAVDASNGEKDVYTQYISAMIQSYYDAVLDLTGHTYTEFAHLEWWQTQDDIFSSQESLLAQADNIWVKMDPEAQSAFITANVAPDGRYGVPVPTPDDIMREIGEMDYDELRLADMAAEERQALDIPHWDEYTQGDW